MPNLDWSPKTGEIVCDWLGTLRSQHWGPVREAQKAQKALHAIVVSIRAFSQTFLFFISMFSCFRLNSCDIMVVQKNFPWEPVKRFYGWSLLFSGPSFPSALNTSEPFSAMGAFINDITQIWTIFDHPPPSVTQS